MTRNVKWSLGPAFVLIVAFIARAWGLAEVGLWHDEAISHFYATRSPAWIIRHCAGFINHPPLFFLLLRGWLQVVPPFNQFAVELMNVLVGTGTVAVLMGWARRFLSWKLTIVTGILMALSPYHIYYSGELRMYALATLGLTVACYFATKMLDGERGRVQLFGWALSSLTALYSHSFTGIPIFFMLVYLCVEAIRNNWWKKYLTFTIGLLLLYAPWIWVVYTQAMDIAGDYWLPDFQWHYVLDLFGLLGGWIGPRANTTMAMVAFVCVTIGVIVPLVFSLRRGFRSPSWIKLLWVMFLGTLLLVIGMSLKGQSVFIYRPFVVFTPSLLLLVGEGLSSWPRTWISVAVVLGIGFFTLEMVQLKRNPPHQYAKKVSQWIDREYMEKQVVVHLDRFTFFPSYFYHGRQLPEYLLGADPDRSFSMTRSRLADLHESRQLLLVFPPSKSKKIPAQLKKRATWTDENQWSGRTYRALKIPPSRSK